MCARFLSSIVVIPASLLSQRTSHPSLDCSAGELVATEPCTLASACRCLVAEGRMFSQSSDIRFAMARVEARARKVNCPAEDGQIAANHSVGTTTPLLFPVDVMVLQTVEPSVFQEFGMCTERVCLLSLCCFSFIFMMMSLHLGSGPLSLTCCVCLLAMMK